ncbi:MAG: carbonic anhydrase [Proteobacteria bacterium]|nr:carbonic anhydrase [Pseudomonadota bacterium]
MKHGYLRSLILLFAFCGTAFASSAGPGIPADEAVKLLKDGNARYVAGQPTHPNLTSERRAETVKGGQHPFATIIGCSDSREPLELIFDQGVGDIFVIRVAGNVAGPDELASIEYGVGHLNTPVMLVLGHTACGAVTAAVQNAKLHGNLPFLINQIKPAVAKAKAWTPTASGEELIAKSIKANVWLTMENMFRKSSEVRELVKKGKLLVIGGLYDLESGKVEWLGAHPDQAKLLTAPAKAHVQMKPKHAPAPAAAPEAAPAKPEAADQGSMVAPAPAPPVESPAPAPAQAPHAAPAHQ